MSQTRLLGYMGLVAALIVGLGEFLVHYNPQIIESSKAYSFFLGIPEGRIRLGHFMMILAIPLYAAGYHHLYRNLKPGNEKLSIAFLMSGLTAFFTGAIWVGSRAILAKIVHLSSQDPNNKLWDELILFYTDNYEVIVWALRIEILLVSIFFAWIILSGKSNYPKWMALFNPFFILLTIFALFFFVPVIGKFLIPAAMNVSHFVLFGLSLYVTRKYIET